MNYISQGGGLVLACLPVHFGGERAWSGKHATGKVDLAGTHVQDGHALIFPTNFLLT
jgi:hypothetical protein